MKAAVNVLFLSLALGALTGSAFAQAKQPEDRPRERQPGGEGDRPRRGPGEGRGAMGQPLPQEKLEAAWNAQATAAAKRLSLPADQTSAVVKAYTESRESVRSAMEEARKNAVEGEGGGGVRERLREAETKSKEAFAKALTDAKVSGDNAAKLNASLGSAGLTGPMWDRLTDTVLGMSLDSGKQQTALNAIEDFVVGNTKAMSAARDNPEEARESRQKARENLDKAMKDTLSAEQYKAYEDSMPRGPGMRRQGGPEGREGREGGRPAPKGEDKPKERK